MSSPSRPPAWPYAFLLAGGIAGAGLVMAQAFSIWVAASPHGLRAAALAVTLTVVGLAQVTGFFYLLGFLGKAASYLLLPVGPPPTGPRHEPAPPTAVLYLTAGDFDPRAVDSLLRLETSGPKLFVLHDDGADEHARRRMSEFIEGHPCRAAWEVAVLHRPERRGGKAGAVNWVLQRLDERWELLVMCDCDSIALGPDALERAMPEFEDPGTAVVQFRNAGYTDENEGELQRQLARAIDVFDAFATPQARWGYLPFFGHNAILRVAELRRLGGLTPGFFSDDLDLSVRLTLAGRRIVYRRDIVFAERHPADWAGFRKRARKWAFGCMQVVRARAIRVLTTPGVPFAHRVGMLEFMGFYPAQALLLAGLLASHLILPWLAPRAEASPAFVVSGLGVTLALLAPTLAWSIRERRMDRWPELVWVCALVYGGSILSTVRGVLDGMSARERPWIPTNLATPRRALPLSAWLESLLGVALFLVPWLCGSPAVAFAATYLFVATFLFAPLTFAAYRDHAPQGDGPTARATSAPDRTGAARSVVALALAVALVATPGRVGASPVPHATVSGNRLLVDNVPFEVRGIHYSPWLPGTGPDGHSPYPTAMTVEQDLRAIHDLGANTVLIHSAPGWVIRRAHANDLLTIYAFNIAWNDTNGAAFERQSAAVLAAVDSLRGAPGLIAWILGSEVPPWVVEQLGRTTVEARLRELAARVRAHAPAYLLGHGNWPPTKELDLSFLDLACFNLYPAWPYEVAVRGYGPYLREVLAPLAHGRPLLITEFGINSLETSEQRQARVITDCWREIHSSATAGGVLLEWCDEWWKNYDNPIPGKGYWERRYDPGDAATHDADPEEYYGIVRTNRTPKQAAAAVRRMWPRPDSPRSATPWIVLAALGVATWFAFGLHRRAARRPREGNSVASAWTALLALTLVAFPAPARALVIRADTLTGVQANAQYGWTVTGAGDLLGDGRGAVVVGARFYTVADTAAGAAFVYGGGLPSGSPPVIRLDGRSPHEHFGESLGGGADVDGDGVPDLVIGAPLRSTGGLSANGAADVFRGSALGAGSWATVTGEASNDWFGQSVAVGDVDGDGRADIIVGAPYNDRGGSAAGAVFIYRGALLPLGSPWRVLVGEAANDQFGWSVAYLGDVNGDGYGDIAVGARLHGVGARGAAGRVYLFLGGPLLDTVVDGHWDGEAKDDWFGNAVAGPGDVDGGGRPDLLVGAPYNDRGGSAAGAAYLFRGEDPPGALPVVFYVGESANAQLGWTVAGAGDVNGDGHADVVAGARLQASGALGAAGRVYLYPGGSPLATAAFITFDGEAANDWLGNSVGNATGYLHPLQGAAIAGAPYSDADALDAGQAFVVGAAAALEVSSTAPLGVRLRCAPNPAAGRTRIVWRGACAAGARFELVDASGRLIRRLEAGAAGTDAVSAEWDGRDDRGRPSASGLYFVRFVPAPGAAPSPGVAGLVLLR